MIITIGGLAGTGTSTTAKTLSQEINIPFISAGDVFRQMAVCVLEYFVELQKSCTLLSCLFCNFAGRNSYLKIGVYWLVFLICFIVLLRNNKSIMRPLPAEL